MLITPSATLHAAASIFNNQTPGTIDYTPSSKTKRRHTQEKHDADLAVIQALELRLGITRWAIGSVEWEEAGKLVAHRKYQRALDELEGLVVARIFELTKMNRSQTGSRQLRKYVP